MSSKNKTRVKPEKIQLLHEFVEGKKYMFSFRAYMRDNERRERPKKPKIDGIGTPWQCYAVGIPFTCVYTNGFDEYTQKIDVSGRTLCLSPEWCIEIR
jgi:hypothetical protein